MIIVIAGVGLLERIAEEPIAASRSTKIVVFSNPLSLVLDIYRPKLAIGSLVCTDQPAAARVRHQGVWVLAAVSAVAGAPHPQPHPH